MSNREKTGLLDKKHPCIPRSRQCELLELKRSSSYYERKESCKAEEERAILEKLHELQAENPRLGLRRCVPLLKEQYDLETTHDKLRRIVKQAEEIKRAEEEERRRQTEEQESKLEDPHDNHIRELLRTTPQKVLLRRQDEVDCFREIELARKQLRDSLHEFGAVRRLEPLQEIHQKVCELERLCTAGDKKAREDLAQCEAEELGMPVEEFKVRFKSVENQLRRLRKAQNEILEANLRLVISIAKKYTKLGLDFQDLISVGTEGLVKATENFNYKRGYKFSTFAWWWIKGEILRGLAKAAGVTPYKYARINKVKRAQEDLRKKLQREPKPEEIACACNMLVDKVKDILRQIPATISMEQTVGDSDDTTIGDMLAPPDTGSAKDKVPFEALQTKLSLALSALNPREREVIDFRFGLKDGYSHTLEETADHFQLGHERIRQIEAKALRKLRHPTRIREL